MPISKKSGEIQRLAKAFEREAEKFHELALGTYFVTQMGASLDRSFHRSNHTIMLWQYYGSIGGEETIKHLSADIQQSDLKWGVRGAALTRFGVIEGDTCDLFVRMAKRAGLLFDKDEVIDINTRVVKEITDFERKRRPTSKPIAATNNDPLAIWLNYILWHFSLTNPGRELAETIQLDPFTLSLLALERLAEEGHIGASDRSSRKLEGLKFRVAMSFPGEKRTFVSNVASVLRNALGEDQVFYDFDYQAQLARPNLDVLLQGIYRNHSDLIVVFLCAEYAEKEWCGLEWRAIRDIIKSKEDDRIMFVRFDEAEISGTFSIDGFIDARDRSPTDVAALICDRLAVLPRIG